MGPHSAQSQHKYALRSSLVVGHKSQTTAMVKSIPLPASGRPHLSLNPSEYDNIRRYYVKLGHFANQVKSRVEARLLKVRGRIPLNQQVKIDEKVESNLVVVEQQQQQQHRQVDDGLGEVRKANQALECYSVEPEGLEAISEVESENPPENTRTSTRREKDNTEQPEKHLLNGD